MLLRLRPAAAAAAAATAVCGIENPEEKGTISGGVHSCSGGCVQDQKN